MCVCVCEGGLLWQIRLNLFCLCVSAEDVCVCVCVCLRVHVCMLWFIIHNPVRGGIGMTMDSALLMVPLYTNQQWVLVPGYSVAATPPLILDPGEICINTSERFHPHRSWNNSGLVAAGYRWLLLLLLMLVTPICRWSVLSFGRNQIAVRLSGSALQCLDKRHVPAVHNRDSNTNNEKDSVR